MISAKELPPTSNKWRVHDVVKPKGHNSFLVTLRDDDRECVARGFIELGLMMIRVETVTWPWSPGDPVPDGYVGVVRFSNKTESIYRENVAEELTAAAAGGWRTFVRERVNK